MGKYMYLSSKKAYKIFQDKGIDSLYHANSVMTSCQFLRHSALLSRGSVIRREIYQTPQKSDSIDKKYGIWFDVFSDSVDIHKQASTINFYGPVLFVLDIAHLIGIDGGKIWVTKLNPAKWDNTSYDERWFTSLDDLEENFSKNTFDQMIVFRNCGGELPLGNCLTKIILDDPHKEISESIDVYSMAYGALRLSMTMGGLDAPIHRRTCSSVCYCTKYYEKEVDYTRMMYSLKV